MIGIFDQISPIVNNTSPVLTTGLVDSWNLDQASGAVTGYNGHDGSVSGTILRGAEPLIYTGKSFDFQQGGMTVLHHTDFNINNGSNRDFAFNMWVQLDTVSGLYWFFNKRGSTGATTEYQVLYNADGAGLIFEIFNTDGSFFRCGLNSLPYSAGEKFMFSGKTDIANNTIKLFKNGLDLGGAITGSIKTFNTTTYNLVFGKASWIDNYHIDGRMDEPRIWIGDVPPDDYFLTEYNNGNGITL